MGRVATLPGGGLPRLVVGKVIAGAVGGMSDLMINLVVSLLAAGAVYGGIRADLKHAVRAADEAHRRIDSMMMMERRE